MNDILHKGNKINIFSNKLTKEQIEIIKNKFNKYKIEKKIKSELDYFLGLVELQSLINKEAFEKCFEDARTELFDFWDNLSYQERNRLILIQTNHIKNNSRFFRFNHKPIWIAFFDELLNSLYHSEIAILELPQYFKLYRQFNERMISVNQYGLNPFIDEFISIVRLVHSDSSIVFYYHLTKSLYYLDDKFNLMRYSLCKDTCQVQPLKEDLRQLGNVIITQNDELILNAFSISNLINEKTKTRLLKFKAKHERRIK